MRKLVFILLPFLFFGCTAQQVNDTLNTVLGGTGGLSSDQIGNGLKEALRIGAQAGANELSAPGGYFDDLAYRILLPEEVRKVTDRLQGVPASSTPLSPARSISSMPRKYGKTRPACTTTSPLPANR